MRLWVFMLCSYIILPLTTIVVYYGELISFYPEDLALDITIQSSIGIILYFLFMTHIVFGSRVKFLERGVGLPLVLRVHGSTTIFTIVFMCIHRQIHIDARSFSSLTGYMALYTTLFVVGVTIFFWLPTPFAKLPLIKPLRAWLQTKVQYHQFKRVHTLMVWAAIIVLIHVGLTGMASDSVFTMIIIWGYAVFVFGLYGYHSFIKPYRLRRNPWHIVDIIKDMPNTNGNSSPIITLKLTPSHHTFGYKAGQFGFFRFLSGDMSREEHPFSFSSSPDNDTLDIVIQDEGDFTHRLFTHAKIGDSLSIDGPYGAFYRPHTDEPVVVIAGGIGITPFIGWMQELASYSTQHEHSHTEGVISHNDEPLMPSLPYTILWLRREDNDSFAQKILHYTQYNTINLSTYSRHRNCPLDSKELLQYKEKNSLFYVCASAPMVKEIRALLKSLQVPKKHIHIEVFNF